MVKSPIFADKFSGMTFYFLIAIFAYDLLVQIIYKITDIKYGDDVNMEDIGVE
jgi:TIGR02206 family protein